MKKTIPLGAGDVDQAAKRLALMRRTWVWTNSTYGGKKPEVVVQTCNASAEEENKWVLELTSYMVSLSWYNPGSMRNPISKNEC